MNQKLNKRLHALLSKQGLMEQKAVLVSNFTEGRTESSKEMTDGEVIQLIEALEPIPLDKVLKTQLKAQRRTNTLRKCFSLFRLMGYTLFDKPDYTRIDNFCIARSQAKKKLTDMNTRELSNLIYQLEKIVSKQ
jgi:hypothetical protein